MKKPCFSQKVKYIITQGYRMKKEIGLDIPKENIKITELYNNSVYFISRLLDDEMIDRLSKTALKLVLKLSRYFSTQSGRKAKKKLFSATELKRDLAINKKPISRQCLDDVLSQITESKLFLVEAGFYGKEKTYTFYIPSVENTSIFGNSSYISSNSSYEIGNCNYNNSNSSYEIGNSSYGIENPVIVAPVEIAPNSVSPQDNLLKITIKDNFIKEVNTLSSSTISNSSLPLNLDKEKIEKVKSKLKDFGVVGIDNLIKYNSLEIIEKQIMYHEFREFKNGSLLYNAIKNNEDAPAEYLAHLRFEENQAWVRKYYNFYSLFGINPTGNANDRKKELTKFLLHNLYQFGYLELNKPALNQELRYYQADNLRFIENRVIKPIKYFLANFKIDELITILESGLEILRKDILQCDRKDIIFKCFSDYGVNVFNLKKSILKINSMELTENENK